MPSNPSPDLDFLKTLLDQPERVSGGKKPDIRDHDAWFKLPHKIDGYCSNDKCVGVGVINQFTHEPRDRNTVTSEVNGYEMCRFCFLESWHYRAPA